MQSSSDPGPRLVVVGGVPGAGKSTAIAQIAADLGVPALDPDQIRSWLRNRLPAGTPYVRYRSLVHVLHTLRVLAALSVGRRHAVLVIHDPATRPARRGLLARLARRWGWTPELLLVDVTRGSARAGQLHRGRVVDQTCFDHHWERWESLRHELVAGDGPPDAADWHRLALVDRVDAAATLGGWVRHPAPAAPYAPAAA